VIDLYSRRMVGPHSDKYMATALISKALVGAYNLRHPPRGWCVIVILDHYTRVIVYGSMTKAYALGASMGDVWACWTNAAVKRFFGRIKHHWILKVGLATRGQINQDVASYIRYYN